MIASLASKVLPMVLKGLMGQIPALKKLDRLVSYMEDDNELDRAIKAHRVELDFYKSENKNRLEENLKLEARIIKLEKLNKKGKK
tara:strand:+ start:2653 stop:2907 length:255 start_codon:yes stop_codon:yes gene_type:complete